MKPKDRQFYTKRLSELSISITRLRLSLSQGVKDEEAFFATLRDAQRNLNDLVGIFTALKPQTEK